MYTVQQNLENTKFDYFLNTRLFEIDLSKLE